MSLRCTEIFLLVFITQSIFAQLPDHFRNNGYQNLPVPEISQNYNQPTGSNFAAPNYNQPTGSNFAAANIPFTNPLSINGNVPANGLQGIPKMQFIDGRFGELLNFVSNINNRQLMANNPSGFVQNSLHNNHNLQTPRNSLPFNNFAPNNPYVPVSSNIPNNNLHNNVPNNNFVSTPNRFVGYNTNTAQYNLPVNNNVQNLAISEPSKINSLTLTGQAFNNGLPFEVVPATELSSITNFPNNNFVNYEVNNGLKLPRSLPPNELIENIYPITPNNPYLSVSSNNLNNNLHNNIPNENFVSTPNSLKGYNTDTAQYNLPENNNVQNLAISKPTKINSLILTGQAFNNGLPFEVVPATELSSITNFPNINFVNSNYEASNGLKLPRSLTANDFIENNYPTSNNIIENNDILPMQSYDIAQANLMPNNAAGNNFIGNELLINNGLSLNSIPNQLQAIVSQNNSPIDGYGANVLPLVTEEFPNTLAMNNFNNIVPNEQFMPNNYQTPSNTDFQQPTNIQNQQDSGVLANLLASIGYGQPTGNNNVPVNNVNTLNLGEFGSFPIFSGLPVIGITETILTINPELLNQNTAVNY